MYLGNAFDRYYILLLVFVVWLLELGGIGFGVVCCCFGLMGLWWLVGLCVFVGDLGGFG